MRMVGWLGSLAVMALTQFSGCGPAPQPVWSRDSHSFFFYQADGSVVQYDLDKAAARTLVGPGERRPHQVAVSPKLPFVAFARAELGPDGRTRGGSSSTRRKPARAKRTKPSRGSSNCMPSSTRRKNSMPPRVRPCARRNRSHY